MKLTISITDDEGKEVCHHEGDPFKPTQFRWPQDKPLTLREERSGDNFVALTLWMFTYAPVVNRELRRG